MRFWRGMLLAQIVLLCLGQTTAKAEDKFSDLIGQERWSEAREICLKNLASSRDTVEPDSFLTLAQGYAETFLDKDQIEPAREVYAAVDEAENAGYLPPSVFLSYVLMYSAYTSLLAEDEEDARANISRSRALLAETHTLDPALAFETADLLFTITREDLADHQLSVVLGEEALLRATEAPGLAPYILASVCNILAEEYRAWHGDYRRAEELLVQAVQVLEPYFPDQENYPRIYESYSGFLNDLASLYEIQGNLNQAERLYSEALSLVRENPDVGLSRRIIANLNLGVVYLDQMRLADAEPLLDEALSLARPGFADDSRLIYCLTETARLHREQGKLAEARQEYEEAVSILNADENSDPYFLSQANFDLGNLYKKAGDRALASACFYRALELRREILGIDNPATATALVAWIGSEPTGVSLTEKTELLSHAIAVLGRDVANEPARVEGLGLRGIAHRQAGEDDLARLDFESALDLAESVRGRRGGNDESRARYLASVRTIHESLLDLELSEGHLFAALGVAESARARSLEDRLGLFGSPTGEVAEGADDLRQEQIALQSRVAALQRAKNTALISADDRQVKRLEGEIQNVLLDLNRVTDELELIDDSWQNHLAESTRTSIKQAELNEVLRPDEAALLYFLGSEKSYAFLVSAQGQVQAYELNNSWISSDQDSSPSRAMLTQAGNSQRMEALRSVGGIAFVDEEPTAAESDWTQRAAELHQVFTAMMPSGLWDAVKEYESLVVLADGTLHAIPFEALVVQPGSSSKNTRFWLDEGPALRYAPSLTSLLGLARRKPAGVEQYDLLSVVNPAYGDEGPWAPLPGTLIEGELVKESFAGNKMLVLEGKAATESNLKRSIGQARYLHLATHGMIRNDSTGLMAAMILTPELASGANGEDGYFHLYEIRQIPQIAELAVLSACETNWGRSIPSEGVLTLSRGFLEAGSRRTVASLWPVSDASTAMLVGRFFEGIAQAESRGMEPRFSILLRDAKKEVRNSAEYSDPYHWAPLVLSGLN